MIETFNDYLSAIDAFDLNYYLKTDNLQVYTSLCALKTTARIQGYYLSTNPESNDEAIARLYSLLQGLFVSIDALYVLSYAIGKSKNYININTSPNLRKLRYIRNDVVGHPANRKNIDEQSVYCVLDDSSVTDEFFNYYVYARGKTYNENVNVYEILRSYYDESIRFLTDINTIGDEALMEVEFISKLDEIIKMYSFKNEEYYNELIKLISNNQKLVSLKSRISWRVTLIDGLRKLPQTEDVYYAIGLELVKIAKLVNSAYEYHIDLPDSIKSIYRFINRNLNYYELLPYLDDSTNPLFLTTLDEFINGVNKENLRDAKAYLQLIKDFYMKKQDDIVYALALPLKEYKKRVNK